MLGVDKKSRDSTSLHRAQIFRDLRAMQAQAAESILLLFEERSLKAGCFE